MYPQASSSRSRSKKQRSRNRTQAASHRTDGEDHDHDEPCEDVPGQSLWKHGVELAGFVRIGCEDADAGKVDHGTRDSESGKGWKQSGAKGVASHTLHDAGDELTDTPIEYQYSKKHFRSGNASSVYAMDRYQK